MTGNWFHIAKAEFQVQTSGIKSHRKPIVLGLFLLGITWALFIAPLLMTFILTSTLGVPQPVLVMVMPGLMRAGIMFIWLILLILPLSRSVHSLANYRSMDSMYSISLRS
ncbi:MAG: hypothetical protein ACXADS_14095 [Candidatus Thorarchaeota archaeon]